MYIYVYILSWHALLLLFKKLVEKNLKNLI